MSSGYAKLFSSMLDSTIWLEANATRLVWVTMMAMADRDGIVEASVPGLAARARVTRDEVDAALACLLGPDPDSRTKAHDGRRVEAVDGGWRLLNYEMYRERASKEEAREKAANRQKRKRVRDDERNGKLSRSVTPCHAPSRTVPQSHDIAEAQAEAEAGKEDHLVDFALEPESPGPDTERLVFAAWLNAHVDRAQWNRTKLNGVRRAKIRARLNEGYTPDQLVAAVNGALRSKWNMGENPEGKQFRDLVTLLRDGAQVERLAALSEVSLTAPSRPGLTDSDRARNTKILADLGRA